MKSRWMLAAFGLSLALGLTPARAENEFLAPVVRVMAAGGATAAPVVNTGDASCCQDSCQSCEKSCTVYTPPMIGNDLVSNVYAGTFINNPFVVGYGLLPQVQRGSFKISDNESPAPQDRWFVTYSYFNNVKAPAIQLDPFLGIVSRQTSNDVHRETAGFEKTFWNGDASIGMRASVIQQDGDIQADSFGDVTIIGKYALIQRECTLISIGLGVTVPTGRENAGALEQPYRSVLVQPYSGFIWNRDRFYVHGFNALIFTTNDNDPKFGTYDLGVGYRLYQADNVDDAWLTYIIPTAEGHANLATTKQGFANRVDFAFPDSLITTVGVHFGLCGSANLTIGAGCPVSGPRLYDFSGLAQLNWSF